MAKTLKESLKRPVNIGERVPDPPKQQVPAIVPRELPGLAISSLGPAPALWTTSYDSVKQFYRPGTSQQRYPPMPTKANPQINAQTSTIVTRAIANIPTPPPVAPTVPPPPAFPLPNTGVWFLARAIAGTATLQTQGDDATQFTNANGGDSPAGLPTSTQGVAVTVTAGTGAGGGYAGWLPHGSGAFGSAAYIFWAGRNCKYQARIVVDDMFSLSPLQNSVIFLGFTQGGPTNFRAAPGTGAAIGTTVGIYAATSGVTNPTNWAGAINGTFVDTGVPVVAGAEAYVEIIMDDTANTTSFSVNGSDPVLISGSNISGMGWQPIASFSTTDSATHTSLLQYFYAQQDF